MDKLLYTRKEAAEVLSISEDTLDRIRSAGKVKALNIGARVYFTPDSLCELIVSALKGDVLNA